jgi:hypothetical protein
MGVPRSRRAWPWLIITLAASLPAWAFVSPAAGAILYETRFDEAPFVPGPFTTQDGWGGFGTAAASIQDGTFLSFHQSVKYDAGASAPGQSAKLRPVFYTPIPGGDNVIVYEADALLTGGGTPSAWGFQFYGPSGGGRGGFNVLQNGAMQLVTAGSPQLPAGIIVRNQWQRWAVAVNMDTQQFDVYIDGVLRAANQPFSAPISTFGAAGFGVFDGTNTTEVGYFDNFSILTTRAVPEPAATGVALAGACVGFARRRRRPA